MVVREAVDARDEYTDGSAPLLLNLPFLRQDFNWLDGVLGEDLSLRGRTLKLLDILLFHFTLVLHKSYLSAAAVLSIK